MLDYSILWFFFVFIAAAMSDIHFLLERKKEREKFQKDIIYERK